MNAVIMDLAFQLYPDSKPFQDLYYEIENPVSNINVWEISVRIIGRAVS